MKPKRHHKPASRPSDLHNADHMNDQRRPNDDAQKEDGDGVTDNGTQDPGAGQGHEDTPVSDEPSSVAVDVGRAMPQGHTSQLPMLRADMQAAQLGEPMEEGMARSMVAEGMHFAGNAELRGPCSIAGHMEGNLVQAVGCAVAVIVTETGRVKGDITAQKISVMGHTDGVLDSGEGEVALHDTATVHGLVRYGRIQVNGADLNATLERANPKKSVQ